MYHHRSTLQRDAVSTPAVPKSWTTVKQPNRHSSKSVKARHSIRYGATCITSDRPEASPRYENKAGSLFQQTVRLTHKLNDARVLCCWPASESVILSVARDPENPFRGHDEWNLTPQAPWDLGVDKIVLELFSLSAHARRAEYVARLPRSNG